MKMREKILFSITVSALVALAFTTPIAVAVLPDDANSPNLYTNIGKLNPFYEMRIQRGGVIVAQGGGHTWGTVTYTLNPDVNLPLGATVVDAYLYLSFDNLDNWDRCVEFIDPSNVTTTLCCPFANLIPPGIVSEWGYCTARYNVKPYITTSGTYKVKVNAYDSSSVYGAMLIVIYQKLTAGPIAYVIIHDGCRWISNQISIPEDFYLTLEPKVVVDDAYLTTMVQGGENHLYDELWLWGAGAPFSGGNCFCGSSGWLWDVDRFNVKNLIRKGQNVHHPVRFKSVGQGPMGPDGFIVDVVMFDIYYHYPPVGGIVTPVNKLALLAPWILLAALIAIATASVAVYWRRR